MFILESYTMAVLFCILAMLCWGSWANMQKLAARNWRFELFYWDYGIGIILQSPIHFRYLHGGTSFYAI